MFNDVVNGMCKHFVENVAMHPSAKRLYEAAEKLGQVTDQGDVARWAGVTAQTLNNWESRRTGVSMKGRLALLSLHSVRPDWIETGEGEMLSDQDLIRNSDNMKIPSQPQTLASSNDVVICQYDTGGAMGSGVLLQDQPGVIKEWRVSDEWLRLNVHRVSSPKNLAIVTGFGDSMRGMFNPGDPLLVDTGVKTVDFDAVYFFRVGDEGFVKRLQRIPGEGIMAISENKAYRDWTIKPGMDFEVFARVVKVWKSEDF